MRKVEENLPATNEGYGTREYWCVPSEESQLTDREQRYTACVKSSGGC